MLPTDPSLPSALMALCGAVLQKAMTQLSGHCPVGPHTVILSRPHGQGTLLWKAPVRCVFTGLQVWDLP